MAKHVALLRGINVGGKNLVPMAALRSLLADLGLADCQTLLQSGNVVLDSPRLAAEKLERLLETETQRQLKVKCDYLVRTAKEWRTIIANNPFPDEAERDPAHLVVMCLKSAPSQAAVQELADAIRGPELVRAVGKQLYLVYPAGIGRSKLTGTLIERTLSTRGTGRNWNTVQKLAALL
ncbi:MAG: DUF1697 domain-containing protein [Planctomycetaceae bacterium]|nr:DUF1697 domain-containing protein [Planctomycetaceae bacterium]